MPEEPLYHLPYETLGDAPGVSQRAPGPILAEATAAELQRIDTSIVDMGGDFSALETTIGDRTRTIATIDIGNGTNTTEFTGIPGTYRDLMIIWYGRSNGSGEIDTLALRFNGDAGTNYEGVLSRNTSTGTYSSDSGTFTVQRAGHIGTFRGAGVVYIPGYSLSGTYKMTYGASIARGNSGPSNTFTTQSGGRWSGTGAIVAIRMWPSGQLWNIDPHITLIGIK